jgi:biotin carboxyl carrier protein
VVQVNVQEGEPARKGDPLLIIESMKMENKVLAPRDGEILKIHVSPGEQVGTKQLLITLADYE